MMMKFWGKNIEKKEKPNESIETDSIINTYKREILDTRIVVSVIMRKNPLIEQKIYKKEIENNLELIPS